MTPRKKIDRKDKKCHREFVWLAPNEYTHLCTLLGKVRAEQLIDDLNLYIGSKGDSYESHYYTIQCWARRAAAKASPSPTSPARGEAATAQRDADRVIELLKDPSAYMPDDPNIRSALHAMLIAQKLNWPKLRILLKEGGPEAETRIREKFLEAYQNEEAKRKR